MTNSNYEVNCDPTTGLCTARLKVLIGKAYEIGADRRGALISERLKDGAEYRGYGFSVETRDVSLANRTATFTASTPAIDRYGDVVESKGWVLDNYKRNPIILFAHDSRSLPIGSAQKIFFDASGNLTVTVKFARAVGSYDLPEVVLQYVNDGVLNAVSVGFIPLEYQYRFEQDEEGKQKPWPSGRIYSKQELLEVSIVPIPANPEALSTGKSFERKYAPAFRAIEIVASGEEVPAFFSEPCEPSYFSIVGSKAIPHGSRSPVDTKVADADPFAFVGEKNLAILITKSSEEAAEAEAENKESEGVLAELVGSDFSGRAVYRATFRIAKSGQDENGRVERAVKTKPGRRVQTVVFSKKNWTLARAEKWCAAHDFKTSDPQHTDTSFRFRQFDPGSCNKNSYETLTENMPKGLSLVVCSKKEKSVDNSMSDKPCGCQGGASSAEEVELRSVVPFHAYPLAPKNAPWDAGKEMGSTKEPSDWKKMSTLVLGDAKLKGSYKLPHHRGPGGKFATVRRGVANALARINQVKGASASDKSGGRKHLLKHMAEFHAKDGKDFDVARFERDLALIEFMRDAALPDRAESITRELVRWIEEPENSNLLDVAKEYAVTRSIELIESNFKAFSNEKINSRLKKAHKLVGQAMSEMSDTHADVMPMMEEVRDLVSGVLTPGAESDEENRLGDSSVADDLDSAAGKAAEARKAVMLSRRRFNAYMEEALDHLSAVSDYAQDQDDEDEEEDEEEKDDESTSTQSDDAAANGVTPPTDGDKDFSGLLDEATKSIDAASNDSGKASRDSVLSQTERSAKSDNGDEFASLLDAVGKNL